MSTIDYRALAEQGKRFAQWERRRGGNLDDIEFLDTIVSLLNEMTDMEPAARIYTDAELVHRDPRWGRVCWIVPECKIDGGALLYLHPAPQPQPEREKPAMWAQSNHVSWAGKQPFMVRCAPSQLHPDFVPLYLHPAPQPRPRRPYGTDTMSEMGIVPMCDEQQPERQPLTNEQIDEIGEPFGYFTYGDAQGDKRRAFVRAIESSHGIGYGKAIEGGPSELRSCTCHPDDNPPAPCAQQYALNECRAAQPERDSAPDPYPDEPEWEAPVEPTEAQIEAGIAELLRYLDWDCDKHRAAGERIVRAALAAKEN